MRLRSPMQVLFVSAVLVWSGLLYGCLMPPEVMQAARPPGLPRGIPAPLPAPTVSLSAEPPAILQGDCATLAWSATGASSLVINAGVGYVNLRGARQVCPERTTQYTLAVRGTGGSEEASATITVTPVPAPTVSLSAHPTAIVQGECATLTWAATDASSLRVDPGVGGVNPEGSREVCPQRTTRYTIAAQGRRDSREASTMVTVTPLTAAAVVDRLTLHIDFDLGKTGIRNADTVELQKAVEFAARYPGHAKAIVGHTDSIGSEAYNQGLSERRADAVRAHLLQHGVVDVGKTTTVGYGESRPVANNATEEGRSENRRVEILILAR